MEIIFVGVGREGRWSDSSGGVNRRMDTDTDFDGFFAVCHFCLPHKSSHTTKTIDDCF